MYILFKGAVKRTKQRFKEGGKYGGKMCLSFVIEVIFGSMGVLSPKREENRKDKRRGFKKAT